MILVIGATYTKSMNKISAIKMTYLSEATTMVEQVNKKDKKFAISFSHNRRSGY